MSIAAVVLAAGASSRLGQPKQLLLDHEGEILVHKVARDAYEAGCRPVCIVVGAHAGSVGAAVADLDVLVVENSQWLEGLSTSIRCGVAAAVELFPFAPDRSEDVNLVYTDSDGQIRTRVVTQITSLCSIEGVLLLTCDMPSVGTAHIQMLMSEFNGRARPVASSYGDTWGIPAVFPASDLAELQSLQGDKGAKGLLMTRDPSLIPLAGGSFDLDTPADVAKWRASGSP